MSELRIGIVRVVANYTRMGGGVIIGILYVALLWRALGILAFGTISLLGPTVGLSAIFLAVVRDSMVRALSAAHHADDADKFPCIFNAALVVSFIAAAVTFVGVIILWFMLPVLRIAPGLLDAARYFLLAAGIHLTVTALLTPVLNMYLVTERMVLYNVWLLLDRVAELTGAVAVYFFVGGGPAHQIIFFGWLTHGLKILILFIACGLIVARDRRMIPRFGIAQKKHYREVAGVGGLFLLAQIANNLHLRLGTIIMQLAFGSNMTGLFSIGVRGSGTVRTLSETSVQGVEAVAARLSETANASKLAPLITNSTRLHAFVSFPAIVVVFALAEPFISIWLGPTLIAEDLKIAVTLTRILLLGVAVRSLAEGWQRILYGAGFIRRYLIPVLLSGFCNPVIALVLLWLLPESTRFTAVAWAYTIAFLTVQLTTLPIVAARSLGCTAKDVLSPLVRPLLLAIACGPVLVIFLMYVQKWAPVWLVGAGLAYGAIYLIAYSCFGLVKSERARVISMIGAMIRRNGSTRPSDK